jgi:hypothetical protein
MSWFAIRDKAHEVLRRVNDWLLRDRERDRLASQFSWLGHYSLYFLAAATPIAIASIATGRSVTWLAWLAAAAFGVWAFTLTADLLYHQHSMCERCISDAPVLDPATPLSRWKWALWFEHQKTLRLSAPLLYLAWTFSAGWRPHEQGWQTAGDIASLVLLAAIWLITWQHLRLQPWCPYCHWGRGGYHEAVPPIPAQPTAH